MEVHKAAATALGVMKGIGEFAGDTPQIGIQVVLAPPNTWQSKYNALPQQVVVSQIGHSDNKQTDPTPVDNKALIEKP